MTYKSLRSCVQDLEKNGHLIRIKREVDPNLEMAEIHRRIYDAQGPAILFERVNGSPFQAVTNIYGTVDRTNFIFRNTLKKVQKVIELKADPAYFFKNPFRYLSAPFTAVTALPMKSRFGSPVTYGETTINQLPQVKSWPMDGGAFVTLPQVFTLPPDNKNIMQSNLGMSWLESVETPGLLGGYDPLTRNSCSEGFVIRNSSSYKTNDGEIEVSSNEFNNLFKLVRESHVKTDIHWSKTWKPSPLKDYAKYKWYGHEYLSDKI